ncbi:CBS domain-containing protein [Rhizobium sp. BK418]|nr:CBS domain-containing protein [Rhizobium sp. BK418]
MNVRSVMTSAPIMVAPSTSVLDAAKLMLDNRISGLPVVDEKGGVVGVVSDGDFLRRGELETERSRPWLLDWLTSPRKLADEYVHAHGRCIEEVMSSTPVTIPPEATISDAVSLMEKHDIKRLPVISGGHLVGILSRSDLLRALSQLLPKTFVDFGDTELQAAVEAALSSRSWTANGFIRCHVKDGVAQLSGTIFDERERLAAKVLIENIKGIKWSTFCRGSSRTSGCYSSAWPSIRRYVR